MRDPLFTANKYQANKIKNPINPYFPIGFLVAVKIILTLSWNFPWEGTLQWQQQFLWLN